MNIDTLLKFNKLGIIPGPGETDEAFEKRAAYCLNLKSELPNEVKIPELGTEMEGTKYIESLSTLSDHYDFSPSWVPLFFSNYKLTPWHGGCAWIFQMTEQSPTAAFIQLRKAFQNSKKYLGIYDRDELLRHELTHVARMQFEEPKFEELIAYRTSSSRFRRWFGPLIQSSWESTLFILLIGILVVFDLFLISTGQPDAYLLAFWLKLIPFTLILLALMRLWRKQSQFSRCVKNLSHIDPQNGEAIAFRLTDKEIESFAENTPEEILSYAHEMENKEPRWRLIKNQYFLRC